MCKDFSCIITKDADALWYYGTSNHSEIFSRYEKRYKLTDGDRGPNFAKVEIVPPSNTDFEKPVSCWHLRVDEPRRPRWFSLLHEKAALKAAREWRKKHLPVLANQRADRLRERRREARIEKMGLNGMFVGDTVKAIKTPDPNHKGKHVGETGVVQKFNSGDSLSVLVYFNIKGDYHDAWWCRAGSLKVIKKSPTRPRVVRKKVKK